MRAAVLGLLFLVACSPAPLKVRIERVGPSHLASHYVHSPDPLHNRRFCGQWMVIQWHLPKRCPPGAALKLYLIRSNHRLQVLERRLPCPQGSTSLYFTGLDWRIRGSIITWRAEIWRSGQLLACASGKPWIEWIDDTQD